MNFFKTSFWASVSTGVTMICGLITTKYVAMMIGPEGMAFVGQFSNSTVLIALFASAACTSGVIKYLAEATDDDQRRKVIANALFLVLLCTAIMGIGTAIFAASLSQGAFKTTGFKDIFWLNALLLIFPTLNGLITAVMNGLSQIKKMALINVMIAIFNVGFILIGAKYFHIKGVLAANLVAGTVSFWINFRIFKRTGLLPTWAQITHPDSKLIKLLLGFSLMSIVSGVIAPSLQLFVRTKLIHNFNADTAGLWQANMRLSDYYLNFVYAVLGVYYLPKLSSLTAKKDLKREIKLAYLRIMPLVVAITLVIWFLRNYIITVLLTKKFEGMLQLLGWQLIGDVIKISSWILGYLLVAKALKKGFIVVELFYAVLSVVLNILLINSYGLMGSVYAFCIGYTVYFFILVVLINRYFKKLA